MRWENQKEKSGYSPACANEWDKVLCGKLRVKCAQCRNRQFLPVTDEVIHDHLSGKHTIGVYPIREDESCWFLAADFDKSKWQLDAMAFLESCQVLAVPACLERSRSGNGGHAWKFFESALPAVLVSPHHSHAVRFHPIQGNDERTTQGRSYRPPDCAQSYGVSFVGKRFRSGYPGAHYAELASDEVSPTWPLRRAESAKLG